MPQFPLNELKPIILSASRSTDLPTFYSEWFVNRMNVGFCDWINPFNRQIHRINFDDVRLIVFWSKNPAPLMKHFDVLEGKNFYFQFTLNDYEKEHLEPNVPSMEKRLNTFKTLSKTIGAEKVIWRFDPIMFADNLTHTDMIKKVENIGNQLYGYTKKLVFSFADISTYQKVQRNLQTTTCRELVSSEQLKFVEALVRLNEEWHYELATCAEQIDLSQFGVHHNKCIDDNLIIRLFSNDKKLMDFIGAEPQQTDLFSNTPPSYVIKKSKKDKG